MLKKILLSCFLFTGVLLLNSQTVCPDPMPTGYNDAPPGCTICEFPFSSSNYGYTASGTLAPGDYGCGRLVLDNEQYFIFIANEPCISFTIDADNCTQGTGGAPLRGLQAFIFDIGLTTAISCTQGCCGNGPPGTSACGTDPTDLPAFTVSTCGLTVGDPYYIIIDGCAGSECDYTVTSTGTQGGDYVTISPDPIGLLCDTDPVMTLVGSPANGATGIGVWTGDVDANGNINPSILGAGSYSATYTFTNIYGCDDDETINFTVSPGSSVIIDPAGPFCEDDLQVTLTASPLGGVWGGAANSSGNFDPVATGVGTHSVIYNVSGGGCPGMDEVFINVNANPTPTITPLGNICVDETSVFLIANPVGGTWLGNVNSNGEFNPSNLGVGTFSATYDYTDANGCMGSDNINFTISPLPMPQIQPQLPLCENGILTNLSATPSGGIWGGAANASGQVDPTILTVGFHQVTYTVTTNLGCDSTATRMIEIAALPMINFPANGTFCLVDDTLSVSAMPAGGVWSGSVDSFGQFNPSLLGVGTFDIFYEYENAAGCVSRDTSIFTITQPADIIFGDSTFCENDNPLTLTATPNGGTWSGGFITPSGEMNPSALAVGTYIVTYTFIQQPANCPVSEDLTVTILGLDPADILGDTAFCQATGIQTFTGSPIGGAWSGVANASGNVDPSTLTLGTHTIIYTTISAAGCTGSVEQLITVETPPTAMISGNSTICPGGGGQATLDLTLRENAPWVVNYTIDGIAQTPLNISTVSFQLVTGQAGNFVLTSVVDAGGCSGMVSGLATVTELIPLEIMNLTTACNPARTGFSFQFEITGGEPSSYMVTGVIGSISASSPYIFTSDDVPNGQTATFTVSDNTGCPTVNEMLMVDCACNTDAGSLQADNLEACFGESVTGFDNNDEFLETDDILLFVLHDGTANTVGNILMTQNSTTFTFDDAILDADVTYFISAAAGEESPPGSIDLADVCLDFSVGIPVVFHALPTATISPDQSICEGDVATMVLEFTGEAPFSVELTDGTILTNIPTGYQHIFSPSSDMMLGIVSVSDANCNNNSASVATITILQPPSADVTSTISICNTTENSNIAELDFTSLITGGDATGDWSQVGVNSGATGTLPNLNFDGVMPGQYRFEYTTGAAQAPCVEQTYLVVVNVTDCSCPDVTTSPAGPFCNDDARLDLSTITVTSEQGTWTITDAPSGSTASVNSNFFDANGSLSGNYELTFTLDQMPPAGCDASSSQVITLSQAVSAGTGSGTIQICNDEIPINLFDELTGETAGGTWTDLSANPAIGFFNNGILTTQNIPNGTYRFAYEVTTTLPCLGDSEEIIIEIENLVSAGDLIQNLVFCESKDTLVNLFDLIENYDLGGTWTDVSGGGLSLNAEVNIANLTRGNYEFIYEVLGGSICPNDSELVQIQILSLPIADAGEPTVLTCDVDIAILGGTSTTGPNITHEWTGNPDDSNAPTTTTRDAGTYILTVTNTQTGCSTTDQVEVTQMGSLPVLSADPVDVTCFGDNDGEIAVNGVTGGMPPYFYSLNSSPFSSQNTFMGLTPGDYTLEVEDADGCKDFVTFNISEPEDLTVTLTTNLTGSSNLIQLGDSVQLVATTTGDVDSLQWQPSDSFEPCDPETDPFGCFSPWVRPESVTTYTIIVQNENGCSDRSSITIDVESEFSIYIPSAFSPNDDGINDEFRVFTDDNVAQIQTFAVFDRWGETIFMESDFAPNDSKGGWDGRFRGKLMDQSVFAYFALVEFKNGTTEIFKGDVTLFK